MPARGKLTPGEITILASGALGLIFSFFDFYSAEVGDGGVTVWSSGLFPIATLMVIFVVIMALQVALSKFTSLPLPDEPLGLTWPQVHLVLGTVATVYAVAFLLTDRGFNTDLGIGFWGVLIACVGALVGAVLLRRERTGPYDRGY